MENWKKELETENFDMKTVEKIFDLYFVGKNIVTPIAVEYDALLSISRICLFQINSNREETLFGVTALCYDKYKRELSRIDLNGLFDTLDDAKDHIDYTTLGDIEDGDLYGKTL